MSPNRTLAGLLAGLLSLPPALGQEAPTAPAEAPPLAIVDARLAGAAEPVTILISKGKIRAVDPRARPLPGMRRLEARGARVAPGRIDAWASLGSPHPRGNALDAYDPYDQAAEQQALSGGVTTVALTPFRSPAISGVAAVVKLKPGVPLRDRLLVERAALSASLGLGKAGPVDRAAQVEGLRKALVAARAYQGSWLDYEEAVKTYVEELKKAAADAAKGKPAPPAAPRPDPKGGGEKPSEEGKKAPAGPKKPQRPRREPNLEQLVEVLEGRLPLRVEAHRAAEIASLLELQAELGLRLVLEGATEAHLLAEALAARDVPVVLGPVLSPSPLGADHPLRYTAANAALLEAAGVRLVIGSDRWPASRFLAENAALAVSGGLDPAAAEDAITRRAAELLGLGDRLGRVAPGYDADLVLLRPEPLGGEQVAAVLVDGEVVYQEVAR